VRSILGAAGFVDVSFQNLRAAMTLGSDVDAAFEFVSEFTSWMRDGLSDSDRNAALTALRTTIADHTHDDGITYESAAWIIQARKH
jgi:hypothetical protein